jgi:hypothetical protein
VGVNYSVKFWSNNILDNFCGNYINIEKILYIIVNVVHRLRLSLGSRLGSRGLSEP